MSLSMKTSVKGCTLRITNVPRTTSSSELESLFLPFATSFLWLRIAREPRTFRNLGFAFIRFESSEAAARCLHRCGHRVYFKDVILNVQFGEVREGACQEDSVAQENSSSDSSRKELCDLVENASNALQELIARVDETTSRDDLLSDVPTISTLRLTRLLDSLRPILKARKRATGEQRKKFENSPSSKPVHSINKIQTPPGLPRTKSQRKNEARRRKKRERARLRRIGGAKRETSNSSGGVLEVDYYGHPTTVSEFWEKLKIRYPNGLCDGRYILHHVSSHNRVIRGRDTVNRKAVALKLVDSVEEGCREMEIQQLVGRAFTPAVLDGFPINDQSGRVWWIIVMEAADTDDTLATLCEKLEKRGERIDEAEARAIARRLLTCVERMHRLKLVHCDIKAAHFMRFGGTLRIFDFGSTSHEGEIAIPSFTPRYASPEVLKAVAEGVPLEVRKSIDIYGIGLIFYRLFAGAPAPPAEQLIEILEHGDGDELGLTIKIDKNKMRAPIWRLLKKTISDRLSCKELLTTALLGTPEDTVERRAIDVLALFSSPTRLPNGIKIQPLRLMRELQSLMTSISKHEILPACTMIDFKNALQRYRPLIVQFSGHGDIIRDGPLAGSLAFEDKKGILNTVSGTELVTILSKHRAPRLQCVFLNGCKTAALGENLAKELNISVVCWETIIEDKAATFFSTSFYDCIASKLALFAASGNNDELRKSEWIIKAFFEARELFKKSPLKCGDPESFRHHESHPHRQRGGWDRNCKQCNPDQKGTFRLICGSGENYYCCERCEKRYKKKKTFKQ
eukprot:g4247.t1